ncbi:hypothetical protein KKE47_03465 [Patescibacteria group bacterium]|nr:hypothetical protein [Patescibacteria group bacterium]MBU4265099.1 hypothetical protein [Patescibacteria group bacterium]MBU4390663.1 hypothetical protein [Patescibacteria group bacterium]MBU4579111.1 hypothetical protein [Patescibacteria group bacterium]MCG2702551.1 hypothetical protein [Candidatus Parcubacteria bacterium]
MKVKTGNLFFGCCVFFLCLVYFLLAFKNPFKTNSLVSNLEPYPDTLYYSVPAWNLVNGRGFKMSAYGHEIKKITPPIYSLYLIPFFALFGDIRSYYFANLLLSFVSILVFAGIIRKVFGNSLFSLAIVLFLGFLFVTNYYFYNLPSLLMAENLTLCVLLILAFLLFVDISLKSVLISSFLGVFFGLIKFSNLSLSLVFLFLYTVKVFVGNKNKKFKFWYVGFLLLFSLFFIFYLISSGIFSGHVNLNKETGFSFGYFIKNLSFYLSALMGKDTRYLWYTKKLMARSVVVLAFCGVVAGLLMKKFRVLVLKLLFFLFVPVICVCFFYYADARYIFMVLPLVLILIGFLFFVLMKKFGARLSYLLMFLLMVFYVFEKDEGERRIVFFKKQVGLNFRHKEDPWNYLAIENFNNYFKNKNKDVYLGSFLPPFYVDIFSNHNYEYLPIFEKQEFSSGQKKVLDKFYSGELVEYYKSLVKNEKKVFVSNYYVNNSVGWRKVFDDLLANFDTELVRDGCLGSCNIYKLSLKR